METATEPWSLMQSVGKTEGGGEVKGTDSREKSRGAVEVQGGSRCMFGLFLAI